MRERALALGVPLADDAYVFADVEGRPWRPDVCTNRFGRLRDRLGLDRVRLHDLRHFVATVLGDGGMPIATISSRLGHRDIATTLNIYTHAIPATDQHAAAYLGNLLAGPARPVPVDARDHSNGVPVGRPSQCVPPDGFASPGPPQTAGSGHVARPRALSPCYPRSS